MHNHLSIGSLVELKTQHFDGRSKHDIWGDMAMSNEITIADVSHMSVEKMGSDVSLVFHCVNEEEALLTFSELVHALKSGTKLSLNLGAFELKSAERI